MRHGSQIDPPNRFERVHRHDDFTDVADDAEFLQGQTDRRVRYFDDQTKSIVSENNSPDIPFRYSINPYRGCVHACPYCYARNSHEFLGLNAGLDFETKIFVKHDAAPLFRAFLSRPTFVSEPIIFSGITDCYQPAERKFELTRGCLAVANECHQAVSLITKNALVLRDLDLLSDLATRRLAHVNLSITTLDPELARVMEPRTSIPAARLRAVKTLADAGIPVRVMMAPLIPGLNDHEIASVLQAAADAGATDARYVFLRLPQTVEIVFREWLERTQPGKSELIEGRIRQSRHGQLNHSAFGERMVGSGPIAAQIRSMFAVFRNKFKFGELPPLDTTQFRSPTATYRQLHLF